MFLQSIENLNPNFVPLTNGTNLVCTAKSSGGLLINFFPADVTIEKGESKIQLDYNELAAIAVKRKETKIFIKLNEKKLVYEVSDSEKASQDEEFLNSVREAFSNGAEDSPYENVRILCEENGIFFDGKYNKYLYHLIFEYNNLFDLILQNGVLPENCSIEFFLKENSASAFDNASGTVTSLAGSLLSGNLVGSLVNAGKKIAKSLGNEMIGNSGILVVTSENVIFAKGTDVEVIGEDIQEAWDALDAERDETMQGAMDIYKDGTKILDNVSAKLWSEYKNVLRKLKNHPKQNLIENNSNLETEDSSFEDNSDSFNASENSNNDDDDIEEKLTKLKRMADNGLISSDDYEKKKNEILGFNPTENKTIQSAQNIPAQNPSVNSQANGKAPQLEKKQIENSATTEKPKKKMHGCLKAFLITLGVIFGLFVLLMIIVMITPE